MRDASPTTAPRSTRLARGLVLVVLSVGALALGERPIRTPDAAFHRFAGAKMLETGALLRAEDLVAYPAPGPFVNPQWGFQVAIGWLEARFGLAGPIVLRNALTLGAVLAAAGAAAPAGPVGMLLTGGLVIVVGGDRFLLAPESASLFLTGLLVALLGARGRHPSSVWLAVPLCLVWAQVHGFALLAPGLLAVIGLVDAARGRGAKLLGVAALAALAIGCNPYGFEAVLAPVRASSSPERMSVLSAQIAELRAPFRDPALLALPETWLLAGILVLALGGSVVARRMDLGVLACVAALLGVPYVRNAGFAVVLAAPSAVLALATLGVPRRLSRRAEQVVLGFGAAAILGFAVWTVQDLGAYRQLEEVGIGWRTAPMIDRRAAVEFYVASRLPERAWADFGSGHALLAESGGRVRPVLCGHTDLYPLSVLADYGDAVRGTLSLDDLLARHPADAFLIDHVRLAGSGLLMSLLASTQHRLVYLDARHAIFVRVAYVEGMVDEALRTRLQGVDAIAGALDRVPARDRGPLGPLASLLRRLGVKEPPTPPYDDTQLSTFLLAAGRGNEAWRMGARAAHAAPDWAPARLAAGLAAQATGRLEEAKVHLRAARGLAGAGAVDGALGVVHLRLGELERARECLWAAVERDPRDSTSRQNLRTCLRLLGRRDELASLPPAVGGARAWELAEEGALRAESGRDGEAIALYREALEIDPRCVAAWYNLGNAHARARRFEEAVAAYGRALEVSPADVEARYNRAVCRLELGWREAARLDADEVLRRSPEHAPAKRLLRGLVEGGVREP